MQSSTPSPSKERKEAPRCGRGGSRGCLCGPCLVVRLLQCAQVLAITGLMYRLYLEWS